MPQSEPEIASYDIPQPELPPQSPDPVTLPDPQEPEIVPNHVLPEISAQPEHM